MPSKKVERLLRKLPRCVKCDQVVYSTVDRSKPSEKVEWKGLEWQKTKPQMMSMFPASPPGKMCYYHSLPDWKIGKES